MIPGMLSLSLPKPPVYLDLSKYDIPHDPENKMSLVKFAPSGEGVASLGRNLNSNGEYEYFVLKTAKNTDDKGNDVGETARKIYTRHLKNECTMLTKIGEDCPVIQLYEPCREDCAGDTCYLKLQYAKGGDLFYLWATDIKIEFKTILNYIKQIVHAVKCLHDKGISHRDIKLENMIFLDKEKTKIALIDFGHATEQITDTKYVGTYNYNPPEIQNLFKKRVYVGAPPTPPYDCKKADLYSLGVAIYLLSLRAIKTPNQDTFLKDLYLGLMNVSDVQFTVEEKIVVSVPGPADERSELSSVLTKIEATAATAATAAAQGQGRKKRLSRRRNLRHRKRVLKYRLSRKKRHAH
jgi:serine/threonine protein kinase